MAIGRTVKKFTEESQVSEKIVPEDDWNNAEKEEKKANQNPVENTKVKAEDKKIDPFAGISEFPIEEIDRLQVRNSILEHELLVKDLDLIKKEFEFKNREIQLKTKQVQDFIQSLAEKYNIPVDWGFDMEKFAFVSKDQLQDKK